jgi:serine phosphatase RsbU (regulator of sigma subunit)
VAHSAPHEFVTLWVGIFDGPRRLLQWVDAGHGYWLHSTADGMVRRPSSEASLIVGIDADHEYTLRQTPISPGDRVLVFSDGVVEQPSRSGEHFGMERTLAALAGGQGPEHDVESLFGALLRHAGTDALGDDVTIASILFQPEG